MSNHSWTNIGAYVKKRHVFRKHDTVCTQAGENNSTNCVPRSAGFKFQLGTSYEHY